MSELTGVPSLSTTHRQVLLRGRGRCKTIKDLHTVEEGVRKKKRKWGLISDTEDDSDDSSEEFVEIVPKLAKRSTPRSKAAVLTPRMKRMKVVERERESPDSDLSLQSGGAVWGIRMITSKEENAPSSVFSSVKLLTR